MNRLTEGPEHIGPYPMKPVESVTKAPYPVNHKKCHDPRYPQASADVCLPARIETELGQEP
jgi:hypothetical protein